MKLKPVNLISKSSLKSPWFKNLKALSEKNRQLSKLLIFGVLAIFFLIAVPAFIVNSYKLKLASTKRAIEDTKIKFKKLQSQDFQIEKLKASLLKEETLLKQRLDLLSSTAVKNGGYANLLLSISEFLPMDLWVNRFIMDDNEIQVSGSTLNSQLLVEFMNKLQESKDFKNTRFISTEKQVIDSHTIYNFQIVTEPGWSQKKMFSKAAVVKAKEQDEN